jgi:pyruvate/2-oxoglutarate dehydrogenase complex dihydrolipoamide dehydrogenase (E3) component
MQLSRRSKRDFVVIGGSYVGLEFAQIYQRFGSEVTVVDLAPRLIAREDADVSEAVTTILKRDGIDMRVDAKCPSVARHGPDIAVEVACATGSDAVIASDLLLAVGRRPNTDDLGLDKAGIAVDTRG